MSKKEKLVLPDINGPRANMPDSIPKQVLQAMGVSGVDPKTETLTAKVNPTACHCGSNLNVTYVAPCQSHEKPSTPTRKESWMQSEGGESKPDMFHLPPVTRLTRAEIKMFGHGIQCLLQEAGFEHHKLEDLCLEKPVQIDNLLELVRKEQNLYQRSFQEIVRQMMIDSSERGKLLSEIRLGYSKLVEEVPKQVVSLHKELLTQRALDNRLLEELQKMHMCLSSMCSELSRLRLDDEHVYKFAEFASNDIGYEVLALKRGSTLLAEYYEMYERQRARLEAETSGSREDCALWSQLALDLANRIGSSTIGHDLRAIHEVGSSAGQWGQLARQLCRRLCETDATNILLLTRRIGDFHNALDTISRGAFGRSVRIGEALTWCEEHLKTATLQYKDRLVAHARDKKRLTGAVDEVKHVLKALDTSQETLEAVSREHGSVGEVAAAFTMIEDWPRLVTLTTKHYESETPKITQFMTELTTIIGLTQQLRAFVETRLSVEKQVSQDIRNAISVLNDWATRLQEMAVGKERVYPGDIARLFQDLTALIVRFQRDRSQICRQGEGQSGLGVAGEESLTDEVKTRLHTWLTAVAGTVNSQQDILTLTSNRTHQSMMRLMAAAAMEINSLETSPAAKLTGKPKLNHDSATQELLLIIQRMKSFSKRLVTCYDKVSQKVVPRWSEVTGGQEDEAALALNEFQVCGEEWVNSARSLVDQLGGAKADADKRISLAASRQKSDSMANLMNESVLRRVSLGEELGEILEEAVEKPEATVYGLDEHGRMDGEPLSVAANRESRDKCGLHIALVQDLQKQVASAETRAREAEAKVIILLQKASRAELTIRSLQRGKTGEIVIDEKEEEEVAQEVEGWVELTAEMEKRNEKRERDRKKQKRSEYDIMSPESFQDD